MALEIDSMNAVALDIGKEDAVVAYFQAHRSVSELEKKGSDATLPITKGAFPDSLLGAFVKVSPDPIIMCSAQGMIELLNPAAQRLLGYNDEEIRGHKFASLLMPIPTDDLAMSREYWETSARSGNLKARKKSGEIFPVDLAKGEIEKDAMKLCFITMRDTSCKQRLKQRVAELQRELLHLSRYTVLGELASAITHELNQPLTAITAYAAAAKYAGVDADDKEAQETLELFDKVAAQATRCGQIIHKLRRLVGDRNIDRVYDDLCSTIQEAVQFASMAAARHNIEISVSLPPTPVIILMDRVQIHILVTNLVKNAIDELSSWRHERKIKVTLKLCPPDHAEVTVADTGPGIAPFAFESIFDPFHTTKPDGLGMGLALSRRIAEAHSGRLAAANRPGGGAMFRFIIPVDQSKKVGSNEIPLCASSGR
jgi:two-component system, LuxR family, sensor kinase FixL